MALNYIVGSSSKPGMHAIFTYRLVVDDVQYAFRVRVRRDEIPVNFLYRSPESRLLNSETIFFRDCSGLVRLRGNRLNYLKRVAHAEGYDLIDMGNILLPNEAPPRIQEALDEYTAACMRVLLNGSF